MEHRLEISCFSLQSAIEAEKAGADRIELCSSNTEGGLTPSAGLIKKVLYAVNIPVFVMIRPRSGDFLYSDDEFEVMKEDIIQCQRSGVHGVVVGILLRSGQIDVERTSELVKLAQPMEVTFHRAFDQCLNPMLGLDEVIQSGCTRLLSSGQHPRVQDGLPLLYRLQKRNNRKIIIMPGAGLKPENVLSFARLGFTEFHTTAKKVIESEMKFKKRNVPMTSAMNDFELISLDPYIIKSIKDKLQLF